MVYIEETKLTTNKEGQLKQNVLNMFNLMISKYNAQHFQI